MTSTNVPAPSRLPKLFRTGAVILTVLAAVIIVLPLAGLPAANSAVADSKRSLDRSTEAASLAQGDLAKANKAFAGAQKHRDRAEFEASIARSLSSMVVASAREVLDTYDEAMQDAADSYDTASRSADEAQSAYDDSVRLQTLDKGSLAASQQDADTAGVRVQVASAIGAVMIAAAGALWWFARRRNGRAASPITN